MGPSIRVRDESVTGLPVSAKDGKAACALKEVNV